MGTIDEKVLDRYRKFHAIATNAGSAENEKTIALRRMRELEEKHPNISVAAFWTADRVADTVDDWLHNRQGYAPPPPPPKAPEEPTGQGPRAPRKPRAARPPPSPEPVPAPEQPGEEPSLNWRQKVGQFLQDVVDQVSEGLSITNVVQRQVKITIESDAKTVKISIKIPINVALQVAEDSGGSLGEFSRLVGVRLGSELAQAFAKSGY
jgi:hypothetical protein